VVVGGGMPAVWRYRRCDGGVMEASGRYWPYYLLAALLGVIAMHWALRLGAPLLLGFVCALAAGLVVGMFVPLE